MTIGIEPSRVPEGCKQSFPFPSLILGVVLVLALIAVLFGGNDIIAKLINAVIIAILGLVAIGIAQSSWRKCSTTAAWIVAVVSVIIIAILVPIL